MTSRKEIARRWRRLLDDPTGRLLVVWTSYLTVIVILAGIAMVIA